MGRPLGNIDLDLTTASCTETRYWRQIPVEAAVGPLTASIGKLIQAGQSDIEDHFTSTVFASKGWHRHSQLVAVTRALSAFEPPSPRFVVS